MHEGSYRKTRTAAMTPVWNTGAGRDNGYAMIIQR